MSSPSSPEPLETGYLEVGEGQRIFYEVSGDPGGKPAVALHGGPGSGLSPGRRRTFAPFGYRLVQFDQRGCGRSTPPVSDPATPLGSNTTAHLLSDIEMLREHLGIERFLVWGGSWGCTLALAYARSHPARVSEMVLVSVTMTRAVDVRWLYHDIGRMFPAAFERFSEGGGGAADLPAAYDLLLNGGGGTPAKERAAKDWCEWEDAVQSLQQGWTPSPRYADPAFAMTFARLCAHYFSHAGFLRDGELLDAARGFSHIPGVLVHGRHDLSAPPDVPFLLARAWPGAELHLVDEGHHGGAEMTVHMGAALERFSM